jgi:hypothetical protein
MSKETFDRYSQNHHGHEIQKQKSTKFSRKWGIHAIDLAEKEKLSPDAIHMRVKKFGTPWQRRTEPTLCENLTGFTSFQLATILNLHPQTINVRILKYKNPFVEIGDRADAGISKGPTSGIHWSQQPLFKNNQRAWKTWLMPEHPCWAEWKEEKRLNMEKLKTEAVIKKQDVLKQREQQQQENEIC